MSCLTFDSNWTFGDIAKKKWLKQYLDSPLLRIAQPFEDCYIDVLKNIISCILKFGLNIWI